MLMSVLATAAAAGRRDMPGFFARTGTTWSPGNCKNMWLPTTGREVASVVPNDTHRSVSAVLLIRIHRFVGEPHTRAVVLLVSRRKTDPVLDAVARNAGAVVDNGRKLWMSAIIFRASASVLVRSTTQRSETVSAGSSSNRQGRDLWYPASRVPTKLAHRQSPHRGPCRG